MKPLFSTIPARLARLQESMREIPDITPSRPDVSVEGITPRRSMLRFFGERIWVVSWRSLRHPGERSVSVISRDRRAGSAILGGVSFSFLVHWRGDLRHSRLRAYDKEVVTPLAVMQLAEFSSAE